MSAPRSRAGPVAASLGVWLLFPLGWLLAHLPSAVGLATGRRLGDALWWVLPRRRAVALDNLRRSFGGECTPTEIRRLGRRSFQHVGMNLVEVCRYFLRPTHVMLSRVRVEGREHFQAAASHGRGVLILTAHFGNWELLAAAHGLTGLPLSIVTRPLDHPLLDDLAARFRQRSGGSSSSRASGAGVMTALKRSEWGISRSETPPGRGCVRAILGPRRPSRRGSRAGLRRAPRLCRSSDGSTMAA